MSNEESQWAELGKIFFILLIIGSIFELGLLTFAYFNADKVECNLLWCTFTSSDSYESHESYTTTSSSKECFVNGNQVNCSEMKIPEYAMWNYT